MKVLVACEFSGIVRDAFKAKDHDAWSCDLLPTEKEGQHIQGDVLGILNNGWDLMIAHPPCTYLSYAATRSWNDEGRKEKRELALKFFIQLMEAPIEKICVENPKGYPMVAYRSPNQIIQPYFFGDRQYKTTCLWLKNLSCLAHFEQDTLFGQKKTHTQIPKPIYISQTTGKKVHWEKAMGGGGKNRAKNRSVSWRGIANAMAEQWSFEN